MHKIYKNGVTLIETLLALTIVGIVVTIVALSFTNINSNQALDKAVDNAISLLSEARSMTLSAVGDSAHGVRVEAAQLTRFRGPVYLASSPYNVVRPLHSMVEVRNVNLSGGGIDFVFERLTGRTSAGTFEIFLKSDPTIFRTVSVSALGVAEEID